MQEWLSLLRLAKTGADSRPLVFALGLGREKARDANFKAGICLFVPEVLGLAGTTGRLLRKHYLKSAGQGTFMASCGTKNKGAVRCDAH